MSATQEPLSVANAPTSLVDAAAKKAARRKRFEDVFPLLKQEVLAHLDECKMPQDARDWFDRVRAGATVRLASTKPAS